MMMEPSTPFLGPAPVPAAPAPPNSVAAPTNVPSDERQSQLPELGPPFEAKKPSFIKRTLGPIIAAIVAFAAKFKAILLLLPKLKLLTTSGSMLVSIAAW